MYHDRYRRSNEVAFRFTRQFSTNLRVVKRWRLHVGLTDSRLATAANWMCNCKSCFFLTLGWLGGGAMSMSVSMSRHEPIVSILFRIGGSRDSIFPSAGANHLTLSWYLSKGWRFKMGGARRWFYYCAKIHLERKRKDSMKRTN